MTEDCHTPLPPQALEGIAQFNAGEYYAQHDIFETLWANMDAPVRILYKAILQIGVGYYQIERGNYRGAVKMLKRGQRWLAELPDVCRGVDVAQLRADAKRVQEALSEHGIDGFNKDLLMPIRLKTNLMTL